MRFLSIFLMLFVAYAITSNVYAQEDPVDLYVTNSIEATGNIGSVEIKVNKFTDVISFQASINWDPNFLVFVEVSNFGIKDLSEDNFGISDADNGHIRFVWEPADANALTVDDSTILFVAKFEFIPEEPQEVPITFTDVVSSPPFPIEFADSGYKILMVNTHAGSITFFDEITGLEKLYDAGITIYPNPFIESINISNREGVLNFIQIMDVHGRKINEYYNIKDQFINLPLSGSSNGIYLINISKNGKSFTRKVVKIPSK